MKNTSQLLESIDHEINRSTLQKKLSSKIPVFVIMNKIKINLA
jgi:hypothetical protein